MDITIKKVSELIKERIIDEPMDGNHGEKHPKTSDYVQEGVPFILVPDLKDGKVDLENCNFITNEMANKLTKGFAKNGDVLLTHKATIGKVAIVDTKKYDYIILTPQVTYYRVLNNNIIDNKYLYYYFKSNFFQDIFKMYASSGGTRAYLGIVAQKKLPIAYPNIDYQRKIVNVLLKYDDLIDNNNKRISILEQMAEEIYKEWFVRFRFPGYNNMEFENGIPKGWQIKKVKECVKRMNFGITYKAEELENDGNVIVIDQSKDEFLGFHNNEPSHKANLDNPVLLFGDHSCKTKIMIKDFSLGENVIPYISNNNNKINNYYLYYATNKLIETEEYKRHWSRFCGFKIFIPPIEIQNDYMKYIKVLEQEKELLWQKNQNLIKQRELLLPRLMSGKLEV